MSPRLFYLSNKSINLQRAFWLVVQNCLLKAGLKGTDLRRDCGNSLQPPHDAVSLSIEQKKFGWLINLWILIGWVLKWAVVFFGTRKCLQYRLLNCQILQTETNSQTCVVIFSRSAAHVFHETLNKLPRNVVITFMTHKRWILMTLLILNFYVHLNAPLFFFFGCML